MLHCFVKWFFTLTICSFCERQYQIIMAYESFCLLPIFPLYCHTALPPKLFCIFSALWQSQKGIFSKIFHTNTVKAFFPFFTAKAHSKMQCRNSPLFFIGRTNFFYFSVCTISSNFIIKCLYAISHSKNMDR